MDEDQEALTEKGEKLQMGKTKDEKRSVTHFGKKIKRNNMAAKNGNIIYEGMRRERDTRDTFMT